MGRYEATCVVNCVELAYGLVADVVLNLRFDVEKSEPRTWDYPGYPGGPCDIEVESADIDVYDDADNQITLRLSDVERQQIINQAVAQIGGIDGKTTRRICDEAYNEAVENFSWKDYR